MNKKEQAAFDAAQTQAREAIALGWPTEPEPKPMTLEEIKAKQGGVWGTLVRGWYMNDSLGAWSSAPTEGCTNGINHSRDCVTKTSSQGVGAIYRTEEDALIAQRWGLCRQMAKRLAILDARRKEIAS